MTVTGKATMSGTSIARIVTIAAVVLALGVVGTALWQGDLRLDSLDLGADDAGPVLAGLGVSVWMAAMAIGWFGPTSLTTRHESTLTAVILTGWAALMVGMAWIVIAALS